MRITAKYAKMSMFFLFAFAMFFPKSAFCSAPPDSPVLDVHVNGFTVTLKWTPPEDADGYILSYAPFPYAEPIEDLNLGNITEASFGLWAGAAFYVAVQAYNESGISDFSNVVDFMIESTNYPIVDTGQDTYYGTESEIPEPGPGDAFYGQDANHDGNRPAYTMSSDMLTVYDNVTGLTWQQGFSETKLTYSEALDYVDTVNAQNYGGYSDWRLPTIKQLYSLIDFRGTDPSTDGTDTTGLIPFIDMDYFDFEWGNPESGERIIDSQWASNTLYTADNNMMFGVNFADGRIKGYGMIPGDPLRSEKTFYVRLCRGNPEYGTNRLTDNGDGTVTDQATGLMWAQSDSGTGMTWENALAWVQSRNAESHLGHNDWRLPNAKELQSIVDYTRSPDTTDSPAGDPVFDVTQIINLAGQIDYPFFWTGTTHIRSRHFDEGAAAVYIAFGRGLGEMNGEIIDVHGAGCQRSDPKTGDPNEFPRSGYGPQGDVQRLFNYVRLVRDADL